MKDVNSLLYISAILIVVMVKYIIFPLLNYINKLNGFIDSIDDIKSIFKKSFKNKKKYKNYYDKCDYFRDIPNKGNLSISYFLLTEYKCWKSKENHVISAMILKLILDKKIEIINDTLTVDKKEIKLLLKKVPNDECLKELYDILDYATIDNILETNELKKYIEKHYEIYDNLLYVFKQKGKNILKERKCIIDKNFYDIEDLNQEGKNELKELYGFRKYLNDFTLINERGINTSVIWEELLIYGTLLGIGDKLYDDIKNICPKNIEQIIIFGKMKSYTDYIDDTMKDKY